VRAGLIIPVSLSKILFTSKTLHKIAALLIILSCFGFAYGVGKHEEWTRKKTLFVGAGIAFFVIIVYGVIMHPSVARADRSNTQLNNSRAYFLYEDHIGRPVLVSEYEDYDTDGDTYGDGSYFMDNNEDEYPYWQVYYNMPFGATDYWASTGITIGDLNTTGIVWLVPFRFPGQYQDFVDSLDLFYNWNRWYMPGMGRYTQADIFNIGNLLSQKNKVNCKKYAQQLGIPNFIGGCSDMLVKYYIQYDPRTQYDYAYAFNTPLNYSDRDGEWLGPALVLVGVGVAIYLIYECVTDPCCWCKVTTPSWKPDVASSGDSRTDKSVSEIGEEWKELYKPTNSHPCCAVCPQNECPSKWNCP